MATAWASSPWWAAASVPSPPDGPLPPLTHDVRATAVERNRPDGEPYAAIGPDAVRDLAEAHATSYRAVELCALRAGVTPERYARNQAAFSLREQERLLESRVLLVGLGGLGGYVLEALARMGVGRIVAADGDGFEASNLNRQLLADAHSLGKPKAEAAVRRAALVNPATVVQAVARFLAADDMLALARETDLVVDALGGLTDRLALREAAREAGLPLVTAAVAGAGGYAATVWPDETAPIEAMAGAMRAGGKGSEEDQGAQAPAVMLAAAHEADMVVRVLAGRSAAPGDTLLFDLSDLTFERVRF